MELCHNRVGYRLFSELDSTNSEVKRLAEKRHGELWVLAYNQKKGRGRRGKRWLSGDKNFTASFLNYCALPYSKILFQKLCWTCHGKTGLGDGPAGKNLNPKPKNFRLEGVQDQSDGELYWKISNGKGVMLPYKHSLGEEQRWQLVNYIRSFKTN